MDFTAFMRLVLVLLLAMEDKWGEPMVLAVNFIIFFMKINNYSTINGIFKFSRKKIPRLRNRRRHMT